jgi:hypothetical protein
MYPRFAVGNGHFRYLSDNAAETLLQRDTVEVSRRQSLAPVRFDGGTLQNRQMTRLFFEQFASVFVRILTRERGEFIDDAVSHEPRDGMPHGSPPENRDGFAGVMHLDAKIRDRIGHVS